MKEKTNSEALTDKIEEIRGIIDRIRLQQTAPAIETDLARLKVMELYDMLVNINIPEEVSNTAEVIPAETAGEAKPEPEPAGEAESIEVTEPASASEPEPAGEAESIEVPEPEKKVPEAEKETRPEKEHIKNGILADRYTAEQRSINDSLAGPVGNKDLSDRLQSSKPITDIFLAIGINDRFKLIKELFNGDAESYNKTINTLNESGNFNEAFEHINSTFNWDMEEESVQMLLELVRRKFIVSQNE